MSGKQPRVPRSVSPQKADDFVLIRGIGPALANRLVKAGIHTYSELASLSPVELAARVTGLSAKQAARQDWIGQARSLTRKKTQPRDKETSKPMIRQHYENFTLEFLLDGKNTTRRTRVVHIQSGDADTWAGWEAEQLINFLARHAGIRILAPKMETPQSLAEERRAITDLGSESPPTAILTDNLVPQVSVPTEAAPSGADVAKRVSQSPNSHDLTGRLSLCDLRVMSVGSDDPILFIHEGEPYRLGLTLDLTEVIVTDDFPLVYKAIIICKQVGGSIQIKNETSGIFAATDRVTLTVMSSGLRSGIYRLESVVRLTSTPPGPGLTAFLEGGLLQVYETSLLHKSSESN